MTIKKLPAGTRIYLTKRNPGVLYVQPDKHLINDFLYVAYDVKMCGEIIIPRGTRVSGDWITESCPCIGAQLQLTKIYLCGSGQPICADSDVFENTTYYDKCEIGDAGYLIKQHEYRSASGIKRRIAKVESRVKTLRDDNANTLYLEIPLNEIAVVLTQDFTPLMN